MSIACRTIACSNWPLASLHQIGDRVHFYTDLSIDTTMATNPGTDLLGHFSSTDVNVEPLCVRKTVCLPAPFVGIFLKRDLAPMEA